MYRVMEAGDVIKMIELLNFDKKNCTDIALLIEDFISKIENYQIDEMLYKNGKVSKSLSNYVIRLKQYRELSDDIKKYLKNFNIEQFLLKKIDYYGVINYDNINKLFCEVQQIGLDRLKDKGYLISEYIGYIGDAPNDCQAIRLSKKGLVELFKINNAKEIDYFIKELLLLGYDTTLLDDYLIKSDLDNPVWFILNMENIDTYCNNYDRCQFVDGVERVDYIELDEDSLNSELIENMLTISGSRQSLYITHPNYIFSDPNLITDDVKEIENIDWDDIDVGKMFKIGCFKQTTLIDCNEIFRCISNNMLKNKKQKPIYLAILEKNSFEDIDEEEYLIRGIIKLNEEKFSLAFNPKYQRCIGEKSEIDNKPKTYYKKAKIGDL